MYKGEGSWFEAIDEVVFTHISKVCNWIREAEQISDSNSNNSSKSFKRYLIEVPKDHLILKSQDQEGSCGRALLKERTLEEKLKSVELLMYNLLKNSRLSFWILRNCIRARNWQTRRQEHKSLMKSVKMTIQLT